MINAKELKKITNELTLLYVEDEDNLRLSVESYLSKLFSKVDTASNGKEGLEKFKSGQYDIVVTDIQMPIMDGLEMAQEIKKINPEQEIVITSAYGETVYFLEAIRIGVNGYIIKPIDYTQMNQELYKSTLKLVAFKENLNYKLNLEEMVAKRTEKILIMEAEKIKNFENTILSFVEMIEDRDTYTGGHSQRVANYSKSIAKHMGQTDEDCELLYRAAIMHDIGKIATPDTVLLKPGKLNKLEYKLIQEHAEVGYHLLRKIPMYKDHAEIILYHHERYDGKGYPGGHKGDEIPLLAHILMTADAFDAMTTNRIYKGRKTVSEALEEISLLSGTQFHPKVVESALAVLSSIAIDDKVNQLPRTEVEKERFSYFFRDQLTDSFNKKYLSFMLERNMDNEFEYVNKLNLHGFDRYNKKYGWDSGDEILKLLSEILHDEYSSSLIFRVHGDDFIFMTKEQLEIDIKQLEELEFIKGTDISFSYSNLNLKEESVANIADLEKSLHRVLKL